jgi:hypothetical protein
MYGIVSMYGHSWIYLAMHMGYDYIVYSTVGYIDSLACILLVEMGIRKMAVMSTVVTHCYKLVLAWLENRVKIETRDRIE